MAIIHLTTYINAPVEVCFNLARSIDLHKISTAGSDEEAIAGTTSGLIGLNEEVTWRATHLGIRQTLTSRITGFKYPVYFKDEMLQGAFKKLAHDHYFEENETGTLMTDHMEFESPLGIMGKLFNHLYLKAYLEKLLKERNQIIKEYAESSQYKLILK